jgi:hypothetical protein
MNDSILLEDWLVVKLEPAAIFRPTSLNDAGMGFALSRKVAELSDAFALPKATFRAWLSLLEKDVNVIFIHGPEILSDEIAPLTALAMLNRNWTEFSELGLNIRIEGIPILHLGVRYWDTLSIELGDPESGVLLRSFLSSELCALVKPEEGKNIVELTNKAACTIFESKWQDDLSHVIANDVMNRIKSLKALPDEVSIEDGKLMNLKRMDESDFERIAIREMENRRVVKPAHKMLLPKVKAAFVK